jgi:hypothetical protein
MAQMSPDVTIARWRKYGKDRLYVAHADGTKIGYWDLVTDEPHPEKPELARLLESAYDVWAGRHAVAVVAGVHLTP